MSSDACMQQPSRADLLEARSLCAKGLHPLVLVLLIGTVMHLPVSFTYHLRCVRA